MIPKIVVVGLLMVLYLNAGAQHVVDLDALDISKVYQGKDRPREIGERARISIAKRPFSGGLHTRTESRLWLSLDGRVKEFTANVGIDDRAAEGAAVEFFVIGEGTVLWRSGLMKTADPAKLCKVNIYGEKRLLLKVVDGTNRPTTGETGSGSEKYTDVDWAEGRFTYSGALPVTDWSPEDLVMNNRLVQTAKTEQSARPRINGARAVGSRPGTPLLYPVAVTGRRPMTIKVEGVPAGLHFDPASGIIKGIAEQRGDYRVTITAKNSIGTERRKLRIVIGDTLALTPPMGWLSWNVTEGLISATILKEMADAFVKYGLRDVGYRYINMDDSWAGGRDGQGAFFPNAVRFPEGLKAVGDYLHARGFSMGIYSSPASETCAGYPGSGWHEEQDAQTWASWGVDYLKYDLCSTPRDSVQYRYALMGKLLERSGRSMIYALGAGDIGGSLPLEAHAQVWRTGVDIRDQWKMDLHCGILDCFDAQDSLAGFQRPGLWSDPDMLVDGIYGKGASANDLDAAGCTDTEYQSQMSLWSLMSAPLFISADIRHIRPSALRILTNPEVIDVDQDVLGRQAVRLGARGTLEVWVKDLADGSKAIGLLNRGEKATRIKADWAAIGLKGKQRVRDLWLRKEVGLMADGYSAIVPGHGVVLVKVYK